MNITLDDGRTELWQWDTGRKIIVDDKSVSEVHYSKYSSTQAITREVIDGKAEIPNFLLQDTHAVTVYAYSGSIENGYTMAEKTFNVLKKPKPANYIETEEDKAILSKLKAEIGNLSELQTEAKDNLVAAINEAAESGGADWAQNDPTAKDYVKNRPGGYDIVTPEKIISEWRMAGSNYVTIELSEPLVKGRSYRLTFSENADYSNPVFDSEVVAGIDDPDKGSIDITVKGYASVMQPVTYPEDPAYYSCNNDVRNGYCRLIALANTETVKIPDKYTNAITYTPQTLTDAQKKQARENVDAASDFVIKATIGSGNAITLDKTFEQIQEAINDGKKVLVDMAQGPNHALLPLISNGPDAVIFAAIGPGEPGESTFDTVSVASVIVFGNQVYFDLREAPALDPNGTMPNVAYILKATQGNFGYWNIDNQSIEEWYTKIKENPSNYPILCLYKGTYNVKYEYEGPLFLYSITDTEIIYKRTLEDGNWVGFKLSAVDGSPSKNGFIKGVSKEFILASSTANSTKKFKITVDDSGTITTMEV